VLVKVVAVLMIDDDDVDGDDDGGSGGGVSVHLKRESVAKCVRVPAAFIALYISVSIGVKAARATRMR